jgi:hypothetical protein
MIYTGMMVMGFTVLNLRISVYHVTELRGCNESLQEIKSGQLYHSEVKCIH